MILSKGHIFGVTFIYLFFQLILKKNYMSFIVIFATKNTFLVLLPNIINIKKTLKTFSY
jgi:hypothetical protein